MILAATVLYLAIGAGFALPIYRACQPTPYEEGDPIPPPRRRGDDVPFVVFLAVTWPFWLGVALGDHFVDKVDG